ncbi:MAG: hypothetical protein RLY16_749 [Bacteroidota bacterium]|jgi:Zn-dependent membrane protease YugP
MTPGILIISVLFMIIGMIVQSKLKGKFETYSKVPLLSGLSGREVAQKMLADNGIYQVQVTCVEGTLTDHYDPTKRTVNLSREVYEGQSIAAAAVAAHECGHAIQHANAYSMLQLRSKLVPLVNISSNLSQWVILAGLGLGFGTGNQLILLIGIVLFAVTTLFALVTLPVEFDASARALKWLNQTNLATGTAHEKAKDALKWAALTYVVSALSSVAMLLQYVMIFLGRGSNNDE